MSEQPSGGQFLAEMALGGRGGPGTGQKPLWTGALGGGWLELDDGTLRVTVGGKKELRTEGASEHQLVSEAKSHVESLPLSKMTGALGLAPVPMSSGT